MKRNSVLMTGLVLIPLAGWMGSCKHVPFVDPTQHTVTEDCDPDTVYFVNDIYPLIISNCAKSGCHDGTSYEEEAEDLSSYEAIMNSDFVTASDPNDSKMIEVLTEGGDDRMPPEPDEPLSSAQIDLISTWIAQGARNNECSGGCDTTNVSYSGTIALAMDKYCTGCHSGATPGGDISLTNYAEVAAIAADGSLMGTITHTDGYISMPYGGGWLPDCKIDEIRIWVENGYPND